MKRALAYLFLGALPVLAVPLKGDEAVKQDLKRLQGDWIMVALEVNGKEVPPAKLEGTLLTIKDNRYIVKVKDKLVTTAVIELNAAKEPRELNMTPQDGDKKDQLQKGIYKIEGDTFMMARGLNPEQERPTQFATWPDTNYFVVTWKRK